jgi:GNAT superfamily N-acetyltransferase
MQVRQLRVSDAPAVTALCVQLGYPSTVEQVQRRLSRLLASPQDACLGAEAPDGALTGWVHIQGRHVLEAEPFAEICGLVVGEQHRGTGVGLKLVEAAEAWARDHGYPAVHVRSNVRRERTHGFYQKHGYALTKTSHVFIKSCE